MELGKDASDFPASRSASKRVSGRQAATVPALLLNCPEPPGLLMSLVCYKWLPPHVLGKLGNKPGGRTDGRMDGWMGDSLKRVGVLQALFLLCCFLL